MHESRNIVLYYSVYTFFTHFELISSYNTTQNTRGNGIWMYTPSLHLSILAMDYNMLYNYI